MSGLKSRSALSPVLPSPAKHEEAACEDRSCSSASSLLLLPIDVHEMFYTSFHAISRFPAVSQIDHQAWVACCVPAETGRSEERRGWKEGVRTCRSGWSPAN